MPAEHGALCLLGEAVLLGLLVAPSRAGLGVAVAATGGFLLRQPLTIAWADRLRGRRLPRTPVAEGLVVAYGATALLGLSLASSGARGFWLPLAAAVPIGLVQLHHDVNRRGRHALPELLAPVALAAVAAAELRASGSPFPVALCASALLAAKGVTAVLYVRARLKQDRGRGGSPGLALASHVVALLAALGLAALGCAPWTATLGFLMLLVRGAMGLSPWAPRLRPRDLGLRELAYGATLVALLVIGYRV